jgi:hypothetical protein
MRPCACDNWRAGAYTRDQCRLCWLFHHDPAYRALWGGPPPAPCRHLGEAIGTVRCPICTGVVHLKLFGCNVHASCTLATAITGYTCCANCPDRDPL